MVACNLKYIDAPIDKWIPYMCAWWRNIFVCRGRLDKQQIAIKYAKLILCEEMSGITINSQHCIE
ncbi:hypothetical protein WS68_16700 [Burkholderia sp. TSV86]|nr:hypothetical protein WS68_16700 [Burkholderia sp. TSV86]